MTINNGVNFLYNGQSSEEFGISLASSFGSVARSGNSENRNIITTKDSFTNLFNFHYIQYDEPLKFDIIIYNVDGSWIDAYKERQLKKWLLNSKPSWLQVDQDDLSDVFYWAIGVSCEIIDVGLYSGGMKVSFQTMEPWAWSGLKKKSYTSTGSYNFPFNSVVDFDEYIIYPQIILTPTINGNIVIKNNTTNETIQINNCVTTEVINLDCRNDKISSTSGVVMLDRWIGKQTIGFVEGKNEVSLTGSFKMEFQYREPIRVGG